MRKLIAFLTMAAALVAHAEQYKILYINTPSITINGHECVVNDTFDDGQNIKWSDGRQAMKVVNTSTGRQMVLTAKSMDNSASLADYIISTSRLSTRPGEALSLIDLRSQLTGTHYLLDYIDFPAIFPTDEEHFFFVTYSHNNEDINKILLVEDGRVVIGWDVWTIDGEPIAPTPTLFTVRYYDTVNGEVTLVTDAMTVIPLDREL